MVDQQIEKLKRQLEADPIDVLAQLELAQARTRVEGPDVYLEPLQDRLEWNECSEPLQDLAINEVAERLKPDYECLETRVYRCGGQSHRIASFAHLESGLVLNLLPGGSFMMGDENSVFGYEKPVHKVTIKPFFMGRCQVRTSIWDEESNKVSQVDQENRSWWKALFVKATGQKRKPDMPINNVSWLDAREWLQNRGAGLRLPSEAEWEFACRSGTTSTFFWGDDLSIESYSWSFTNCYGIGHEEPREVTLHFNDGKWNAFGLVDMIGNLREWCEDDFRPGYSHGPFTQDPWVSGGFVKIHRGGYYGAGGCCSDREYSLQDDRHKRFGFRVARSLPTSH